MTEKPERLTLTIEDDDGFWSVWPAPKAPLIGSADYVGLCELMHDTLREQWEEAGRPDIGKVP